MRSQFLLRAMLVQNHQNYQRLSLGEKLGTLICHFIQAYRGEQKATLDDIAFFSGCAKDEAAQVMENLEQLGWVRQLDVGQYVVVATYEEPS